jgi:hypothetical protein
LAVIDDTQLAFSEGGLFSKKFLKKFSALPGDVRRLAILVT